MGIISKLFGFLESILVQENAKSDYKDDPSYENYDERNVISRDKAQRMSGDVIIPDGVTEIEDNLFFRNERITSITVPGSVKRIGESAFEGCVNLREVILHEGIEKIEMNAFACCGKIQSISYPDSVKMPHGRAFYRTEFDKPVLNASGTVLVFCPESISGIEWSVPDSVKTIGRQALFYNKGLETLHLPKGLERIEDEAITQCGITEITIPDSVKEIGKKAIGDCKQLEKITILNPNTKVAINAFGGCYNIKEINSAQAIEPDQIRHLKGLPYLSSHLEDAADLNHRSDPEFKRLTSLCAAGDSEAMYALAEWFGELSRLKEASPFYLRASNFWRYRAYMNGNDEAVKWFKHYFSEHPGERMESILYEYPLFGLYCNSVSGNMLNDLGFDFFRSNIDYGFEACEDERIITVSTYAGYDGPDEDGFGMEEYDDYWFLDENLCEIPGVNSVNASFQDKLYGKDYKNERAKAERNLTQRKGDL